MSYDFPATITFQERTTDWHYFIDCDKLKWSGQGATLEDAKERALATVERLKVTGEITYVYKEKLIAEDKKDLLEEQLQLLQINLLRTKKMKNKETVIDIRQKK